MTHDLDDKIIAAIRAGSCRFGTIGSRVGAVDRVLDRALQRLRRAGKIACKGTLWSVVEDRAAPPHAGDDPTPFFLRWLCEIRRSMFREGWEDGRTDAEILNDVTNVLANFDCDPGTDDPKQIAKFNELLAMPRTYHPGDKP